MNSERSQNSFNATEAFEELDAKYDFSIADGWKARTKGDFLGDYEMVYSRIRTENPGWEFETKRLDKMVEEAGYTKFRLLAAVPESASQMPW
ncbi:MAG: hypothetical protein AABX03_00760 [Nanoarchaeota archaeon]